MIDIDTPDKWDELPIVSAGKRLGVQNPVWMGDDWFTSWSPRNGNCNAEGMWCQWVHMARLILADPRTAEQMPEFALPYPDPPHMYDEHHPACKRHAKAETEREALAREEHRHDVAMGNYWDDDDPGAS